MYNLLKGTYFILAIWLLNNYVFNLYYSQEIYKRKTVWNSVLKQRIKKTRFIVSANKILKDKRVTELSPSNR